MARRTLYVALVVALVVLAGCTGGPGSDPADSGPGETATNPAGTATTPDGGELTGDTGTITFYVSDEPNAIDDFEHLNVTITAVGLHRGGSETSTPDEGTATPDEGTSTPEGDTGASGNGTATPTATPDGATPTPDEGDDDGDEDDEGDDGDEDDGDERDDDEDDGDERDDDGEDDERDGDGEWVEYQVNATVDLTELVGANASKLDVLEAPAGTYDKVFVYVEEIDATLKNGESVRVKLPSEKLHITKEFEVGNGEAVEFVFDIAVHKAGKSGKYILKPVVSQSGTGDEVEIDDRDDDEREGEDEKDEREREGEGEGDDEDDGKAGNLQAEFVGPVEPGKQATVKVTGSEGPAEGATVAVNGEGVGETGEDGTVTFEVPPDAEKIEVDVEHGDREVELEQEFEDERGNGGDGNGSLTRPLA